MAEKPSSKKCPECESDIPESVEVCSVCGYAFEKDLESTVKDATPAEDVEPTSRIPDYVNPPENDEIKCSGCGAILSEDAKECLICGAAINQDQTEQTDDLKKPHIEAVGKAAKKFADLKKEKGEPLAAEDVTEQGDGIEVGIECPFCNAEVFVSEEICSECGMPLIEETLKDDDMFVEIDLDKHNLCDFTDSNIRTYDYARLFLDKYLAGSVKLPENFLGFSTVDKTELENLVVGFVSSFARQMGLRDKGYNALTDDEKQIAACADYILGELFRQAKKSKIKLSYKGEIDVLKGYLLKGRDDAKEKVRGFYGLMRKHGVPEYEAKSAIVVNDRTINRSYKRFCKDVEKGKIYFSTGKEDEEQFPEEISEDLPLEDELNQELDSLPEDKSEKDLEAELEKEVENLDKE